MVIGVPKEIKDHEYRVSVTPDGVRALRQAGHEVWIERSAGVGSGYSDEDYRSAGATMAESKEQLFQQATLIVKVKEPLLSECHFFRPGQTLFTYLHLASLPDLTKALLDTNITAIAYETIEARDGTLPILKPMSEIAGRMSVQDRRALSGENARRAAEFSWRVCQGWSLEMVVVFGAGVVGSAATRIAVGMGAHVIVINLDLERLRALDELYRGRIVTRASTQAAIDESVMAADLVIGAVLVPGARAPKLVSRELVARMKPGAVVVDVAVDQGGCFETTKPTTHSDPVYMVDRRAPLWCVQYAGNCSAYVDCSVDECHTSVSSASGIAGSRRSRTGRRGFGERSQPVRRKDYLSSGGRCPWLAFRPSDIRQSPLPL